MKRKKRENPILYKKFLQTHREENELEEISEMVGAERESIIVHKVSVWGKLIQLLADAICFLLRTVIIAVIVSLIALGITVLINENLRIILVETINNFLEIIKRGELSELFK